MVWTPGEPVRYEPHPELGWRAKAGQHTYEVGGRTIGITTRKDGTRTTGPVPANATGSLALLGGSFAEGWALSNPETIAWKLQLALPDTRVRNFATGGYGTYQSLLVLEGLLASEDPPDRVIYALNELHEERNVAGPAWLHTLAWAAESGQVAVPYATLEGGALVRHPPRSYPEWPLRERLALVSLLEGLFVLAEGRERMSQRHAVSARLIGKMNRIAHAAGSEFIVAILFAPQGRTRFVQLLQKRGIERVDCSLTLTPQLVVPGDGHPNAHANERWAECLLDALASPRGSADAG